VREKREDRGESRKRGEKTERGRSGWRGGVEKI
jgi:hypothetical protein